MPARPWRSVLWPDLPELIDLASYRRAERLMVVLLPLLALLTVASRPLVARAHANIAVYDFYLAMFLPVHAVAIPLNVAMGFGTRAIATHRRASYATVLLLTVMAVEGLWLQGSVTQGSKIAFVFALATVATARLFIDARLGAWALACALGLHTGLVVLEMTGIVHDPAFWANDDAGHAVYADPALVALNYVWIVVIYVTVWVLSSYVATRFRAVAIHPSVRERALEPKSAGTTSAAHALLSPGVTVDRYVIEGLLGTGGMGEVYRARDPRLRRSVALKILHPETKPSGSSEGAQSTDGAARMLREARAAAALAHPNVVAIYDVGRIDEPGDLQGTTYLAMELIKGKSLRALVGDAHAKTDERIRWLADVARALAAAHRVGLVHRDVKPENVMLRRDGLIKMLDFGIARRADGLPGNPTSTTDGGYVIPSVTASNVVVGTPLYMAPEQLRAEALDGRADQFSWGVLAYEMLSGKVPWTLEGGAIAIVSQILSGTAPSLSTVADVPPHVAATVARAMQKGREARFASMDDLLEALMGRAT